MNLRKFDQEIRLQNWFDERFYSNEIGLRKPDPKAFLHVSGALAVGMRAHHVTGFGDLQLRLMQLGILGSDYGSG